MRKVGPELIEDAPHRKRELLRFTRDKRVKWARSFGVMGPGGVNLGPGL